MLLKFLLLLSSSVYSSASPALVTTPEDTNSGQIVNTSARASNFAYRDNWAAFDNLLGWDTEGQFTVEEVFITTGQDPDEKNKPGDVKTLDKDGKVWFTIGHKASEDVARQWNERIHGDQTTFSHEAGSLNFAFIGTLTLRLSKDGKPMRQSKMARIGVAQGHSGSTNNWWFGGEHCQYCAGDECPRNSVRCTGYDQQGNETKWGIQRGTRNGLNEFTTYPLMAEEEEDERQ
jgi:hypothetical protein